MIFNYFESLLIGSKEGRTLVRMLGPAIFFGLFCFALGMTFVDYMP